VAGLDELRVVRGVNLSAPHARLETMAVARAAVLALQLPLAVATTVPATGCMLPHLSSPLPGMEVAPGAAACPSKEGVPTAEEVIGICFAENASVSRQYLVDVATNGVIIMRGALLC
jgi:hypothetical protein